MRSDAVRGWVRADFGIELAALDPVGLGADTSASLWRGTSTDGVSYAVKWTAGRRIAGAITAIHLAQLGLGVSAPIRTLRGDVWSERDERLLLVAPWLSGDRAVERRMTRRQWTSFGNLLAQVHAAPLPTGLRDALPVEDFSHAAVSAVTRAVDDQLRRGEVADDESVRALAADWVAGLGGQVRSLLTAADDLGSRLRQTADSSTVLCHGDPHLGNVLLVDDTPWLLDWDDAVLAPQERDLVLLMGGMGPYGPATADERAWFAEGYGSPEVDPIRLAYYRCTRATEDVVYFAADVLDLDRPAGERAELLEIIRSVAGPTGLVRLAMSALEELGRTAPVR